MKRFEKIPAELKKGRTKIVRDVNLDELLANTMSSQYSATNLIAGFIELALKEYVFLKEKALFSEFMGYTLEYPSEIHNREFADEFYSMLHRLEKEFRERFCSDPPDGRIEWGKVFEALNEKSKSA